MSECHLMNKKQTKVDVDMAKILLTTFGKVDKNHTGNLPLMTVFVAACSQKR